MFSNPFGFKNWKFCICFVIYCLPSSHSNYVVPKPYLPPLLPPAPPHSMESLGNRHYFFSNVLYNLKRDTRGGVVVVGMKMLDASKSIVMKTYDLLENLFSRVCVQNQPFSFYDEREGKKISRYSVYPGFKLNLGKRSDYYFGSFWKTLNQLVFFRQLEQWGKLNQV